MIISGRFALHCALGFVVLALLAGCGSNYPPVVPVSGKVTYQGKAVEGANVAFFKDGSGTPAVGLTKADGTFQLTSHRPNDGAAEGSYKATVTKIESTAPAAPAGESMEAAAARGPTATADKPLLPAPYASPATTPLSYTVTKGQKNHFEIDLQD